MIAAGSIKGSKSGKKSLTQVYPEVKKGKAIEKRVEKTIAIRREEERIEPNKKDSILFYDIIFFVDISQI